MVRLVDSSDFERVLRSPSRARTSHFAVHHLPSPPGRFVPASAGPLDRELSTIDVRSSARAVDDFTATAPGRHLGVVIPKRHARRAVTRSLLKRQVRAASGRHGADLASGLWIVRLRAPFDRAAFPSAGSAALRAAARAELDSLFHAVAGARAP